MKKLTSLFIICFVINNGFSQDKLSKLQLGMHTGMTFSWMGTNDNKINSNGVPPGFKIGLNVEYSLNEKFSLCVKPRLAFAQGGRLKHTIGGNFLPKSDLSQPLLNQGDKPLPDGVDIKYSLQILELPFSLKMKTRDFGYISYFAELPILSLNFVTKARGSIEGTGVKAEKENINKDVNNLGLGIGAGLGLNYAITNETTLSLGLYYNSIFTDMTEDNGWKFQSSATGKVIEDSKATMGQIAILFGVNF